MDVKAIVIVGGLPKDSGHERICGLPIAYLDVVGKPLLQRVVERLQRFGTSTVTVVSDADGPALPIARGTALGDGVRVVESNDAEFWANVEAVYNQYCDAGAEIVLALRVGPYAELDYEEMIQHHLDHHCRVSSAVGSDGLPLETFVLSTCRRSDGVALFRSGLQVVRKECDPFQYKGYLNRLKDAHDLRCLALDALMAKNSIHPEGEQKKPGVWVAEGAHIHRKARVTAPAFIGARARIHAAALVTRGSNIERGSEIDCGTVVENSTVLPFTYIGAGLDVMHAVVGFSRIMHLIRNVDVEIADRKLLADTGLGSLSRMAGSAAAFFAFLPTEIVRGFFARGRRPKTPELPDALHQQPAALETPEVRASGKSPDAPEFPSNLVVARRYGDQ